MTNTNTAMPTPTCENCGRDKTPTYICDACCDKLNAITRKRASDYAKLEAELEHWKTGSAHEAHFGDEARQQVANLEAENAKLTAERDKWRSAGVESDAKLRAYTGADLDAPHTEADDIAYKAVAMLQEQSIGGITIHMAARSIVAFAMAHTAANATLDRLREVVNKWMEFDGFTAYDVMDAIRPILYPTPENNHEQ